MSSAMTVKADTFENEVLKSPGPVLVDFWAEWCGPCKMLSPILDDVAKELGNKVKICKVNVDESPDLASTYNVMSIPTLYLFKNGEPVDQIVGLVPKAKIIEKINSQMA